MRVTIAAAAVVALAVPGSANAATAMLNARVQMSDGVTLQATVTGQAPLAARPVIVEFSPYGAGSGSTYDGTAYNYLLVQIRGTGNSDGEFDALGPRTQEDVAEALDWACRQSWSNGRLGLNGFSASAITVYNSLHLKLPCVQTAVLRSGTFELYRDLLWPGGVSNSVVGAGVLLLIGSPAAKESFGRSPVSNFDTAVGLFDAGVSGGLQHQTLDSWWQQRGFRGEVNHLPILMLDSFFDVESRGAFQAFQALQGDGAHLLLVGGHDGAPAGTDAGDGATKEWFDHYLLGANNGIVSQPRVQMLMANGSHEGYEAGNIVRYNASDWPVPGTRWESLWMSPVRSGSGHSINDGSLDAQRPTATTTQSYAAIPTEPSSSDVPNEAFVGPDGLNQAATQFPLLTETAVSEPQALTYTTAPLGRDLLSAGPAALDVRSSSTTTETAMWAVISDVWPDGSSHPVAAGRLLSAYPKVIATKSLYDGQGDLVQPYGDYSAKSDDTPAVERSYQIEFWPIGNDFRRGHRIRLVILGASAASMPSVPAVNSVRLGGPDASRLLLPMLPAPNSSQPHCPLASGRIQGQSLGPLRLGMTRGQAHLLFPQSTTRGRHYMVFYCLAPKGIRAGYPSPKLLRALSPAERRRVAGRAVLLLSAYKRYVLRGVKPGTTVASAARRLGLGRPFHVGLNWWYLVGDGQSRGVLKVRHGVIEEVGIANAALTSGRHATWSFLTSFSG